MGSKNLVGDMSEPWETSAFFMWMLEGIHPLQHKCNVRDSI